MNSIAPLLQKSLTVLFCLTFLYGSSLAQSSPPISETDRLQNTGSKTLALYPTNPSLNLDIDLSQYPTIPSKRAAIEGWKNQLKQWQTSGDRAQAALTLTQLAFMHRELGAINTARQYYNEALTLNRELENRLAEASILAQIAGIHVENATRWNRESYFDFTHELAINSQRGNNLLQSSEKDRERAQEFYRRSLAIFQKINEGSPNQNIAARQGEATVLISMAGVSYLNDDRPDRLLDRALAIYQEIGDRPGQALVLGKIAELYLSIEYQKPQIGSESFDRAIAIYEALNKNSNSQDSQQFTPVKNQVKLLNFAVQQWWSEDREKALNFHDRALTLAGEIGDRQGAALTLQTLAERYEFSGDASTALKLYDRALTIYRELGDSVSESEICDRIALIHARLQNWLQALDFYRQQLISLAATSELYKQLSDPEKALEFDYRQATILFAMAGIHDRLEQRDRESEAYSQGRSIYRTVGDLEAETSFLLAIAERYKKQDRPERIEAVLKEAIALYQETEDLEGEAQLWSESIAFLYTYGLREPEKGLEALDRALVIYQQLGDRQRELEILETIAYFYIDSLGDLEKALSFYQKAAAIHEDLDDPELEISTLIDLAKTYYLLGDRETALLTFKEAASIGEESEDLQAQTNTLRKIIEQYLELEDSANALEFYQKLIPLYQQLNDIENESNTWRTIGELYYKLDRPDRAIEAFTQSHKVSQENGDRPGEAWSFYQLAKTYTTLGDLEKALDAYNRALPIYIEELEAPFQEGRILDISMAIGEIYAYLKQPEKALEFCDRSLNYALEFESEERLKDREVFREIGQLCYRVGNNEKALKSFNLYRQFYEQLGTDRAAIGLIRIGEDYADLGDAKKAFEFFNEARKVYQKAGFIEGELNTLRTIGKTYLYLNKYQQSLEFFDRILVLSREIGDRQRMGTTLFDLGSVYMQLGDWEKALDVYNRSLEIYQEIEGEYSKKIDLYTQIAAVYQQLENFQKALEFYQKSVGLSRQSTSNLQLHSNLRKIGKLYAELGELEKALEAFDGALNLNEHSRFYLYTDLGQVYSQLGDSSRALALFQKSLQVYNNHSSENKAGNWFGIAQIERNNGNFEEALTSIETALKLIEEQRMTRVSPEERQNFFASKQEYYEFYIDLLMELQEKNPSKGYNMRAFEIAERSKARSLLDLLAEAEIDINKGIDPELAIAERQLQEELDAIERRRVTLYNSDYTSEQAAAIEMERQYLLQKYQELQTKIRKVSPSYADLTQPQPLTTTEIQEKAIDDDTLLLHYFLGEKRSFLWAVGREGITSYQLPPKAEIEEAVETFRKYLLQSFSDPIILAKSSGIVYEMLLNPVAEAIGDRRLSIVADGILNYLPFSAISLPDPSGNHMYLPLAIEREIVNLPSASTLAILRRETQDRNPAPKTIAIFADPVFNPDDKRLETPSLIAQNDRNNWEQYTLDRATRQTDIGNWTRLPGTRREAEAILALVEPSQRSYAVDFGANRTAATDPQLRDYQILHFATHGLLNNVNPNLSGILLSMFDKRGNFRNGFLRLNDVFNLDLQADLVVLSACQTGLGKPVRGEGLVGLTRGFMYAGAPRVIVSLWNVDDVATAEMMSRFYRLMFVEKLSPTAALRAAQLEMQRETEWKLPYYWAAFTLQGDWR
jgi:CHAT domain-containing protein/cytochrome c-type biogenesis protein CcmH/NrfG